MRINKKGRVNGNHSQHRVSLMIDDENWVWYCNLNNKARAINDLMAQEQKKEDEKYYEQIITEKYTCEQCIYRIDSNGRNCRCSIHKEIVPLTKKACKNFK